MAAQKFALPTNTMLTGSSRLHLSWLEEAERIKESSATFETFSPGEAHTIVTYTWTYEGALQVGSLMICIDEESSAHVAWTDSWHQSTSIMILKGTTTETGISVLGAYPAGDEGPDWGWRITLDSSDAAIQLMMFNITPEGEEEWAVEMILS